MLDRNRERLRSPQADRLIQPSPSLEGGAARQVVRHSDATSTALAAEASSTPVNRKLAHAAPLAPPPRRKTYHPRRRNRRPRTRPSLRPRLEPLEDRTLPATVSCTNAAGGSWDVGSNRSGGLVPTSVDDVIIDVAGANPTITLDGATNRDVRSLSVSENLVITAGRNLTVTGTAGVTVNGTITLGDPTSTTTAGRLLLAN